MNCRNCGHGAADHPGRGACAAATETSVQRTECACPAYNVRPRVPRLSAQERARVMRADLHDLDRQIGALTARRDRLAAELEGLGRISA